MPIGSLSKALLELGSFRSPADGAIGRLVLPLQAPHRWSCDPDRPRQSYRPLRVEALRGHGVIWSYVPNREDIHSAMDRIAFM